MTKCKNCGFEVDAKDNFCKKCGMEVDHTIDPICINCGFEYAKGDKFCKKCGTKIDAIESEREEIEKPTFDKSDYDKSDFDKIKFDYKKPYDELYDDVIDSAKKEPKIDTKKVDGFFSKSEKEDINPIKEKDDREFNESELEVPSFFGKSKKVISDMFKEDKSDVKKTIIEDESEEIKKDEKNEKPIKVEHVKEQESKDHTVLLPSIEEYEQSSRFENRVVLSDEKKRLIRESKEKADNINHEIEKPEVDDSDDALTLTQKLKLGNESDRSMENRKVRSTARKKKSGETPDSSSQKTKEKKVDEKKPFKWSNLLIPVLIVLAVCTFLYATLSGLTDKKRVIAKFENAITEENNDALRNLVISSDENVSISQDTLKPFTKLMRTDQIYRSSLIGAIKEDSSKLGIDENYKSNRAYRLENTGKKYLFFKDYKVVVDPLHLSVTAPEDAKYTVMEKEISGNSENMTLLPGIYDVENKVNGERYQINLSPTNENLQDGNLIVSLSSLTPVAQESAPETAEKPQEQTAETPAEKPAETPTQDNKWAGETEFHIDTTQKDATVYINDENTNLTVEQYNQIPLKSVVSGDRIKIGLEYPWGMGFSKETTLSGEALISLYVDMNNEGTMNHIMSRIEKMLKEDGMARRNMSMDGFTTIIEPELNTTREILQRGIDSGMTYYRVYDELHYDPSSFEVNSGENGTYTAFVGGNLKFHATEYPKDASIEDGYQPYELSQITGFNLTYLPDKNEWFVSSWGESDRLINLENPVVHKIGE